jgi:hypothetical protein
VTDPLLLTEEQAAERLLMHPRTLRKLRQEGAIRYVALTGRKIAYRPEDCEAFIQNSLRIESAPDFSRANGRGRARPRRQQGANVLSFTARRQAGREGRTG